MNATSKKLLSFVIVLAMVLSMSPVITLPAAAAVTATPSTLEEANSNVTEVNNWITMFEAAEEEGTIGQITSCPFCGDEGISWTADTNAVGTVNSSSSNKHVYLTYSETYEHTAMNYASISSGYKLCLYLNGAEAEIEGHLQIKGTLNIFGEGKITKVETTRSYTDSNTGNTTYYANLPLFNVNGANGVANIYGGTYESQQGYNADGYNPNGTAVIGLSAAGKINIYGGTFKNSGAGEVLRITAAGVVKMYGGEFQGGTGYVETTTTTDAGTGAEITTATGKTLGGNVYITTSPASAPYAFTMYAGTIKDGRATRGGNIWAKARFTVNGGNIQDGVAGVEATETPTTAGTTTGTAGYGGNIYTQNCSLDLLGGTITRGRAHYSKTLEDDGETITNAGGEGGNVCNFTTGNSGTITINGATISYGNALYGGNIYNYRRLVVKGNSIIQNGEAVDGGNIYFIGKTTDNANNTLNISAGTIENGTASASGGNIYVPSGSNVTVSGTAKITKGVANGSANNTGGGNIYAAGATTTISGGEISEGKTNNSSGVSNGGGNIYGSGTVTVSGTAKITKGVANGSKDTGGNIFMAGGKLNVQGGEISNGTANGNGGGNVWATGAGVQVNISGGKVTGGEATRGGGIYMYRGELNVSGDAEISGGVAEVEGGNIYYRDDTNKTGTNIVNIRDNAIIKDGTAGSKGADIYINNAKDLVTLNVEGGTITGKTDATVESVHVNNRPVNLSGGTITGTANKDGNALLAMGDTTVHLSGDAKVQSESDNKRALWIPSAAKLNVEADWSGTAYVLIQTKVELGGAVETARGQWGTTTDGNFAAGSGESAFPNGKLYQGYAPYAQIFGVTGGALQVAGGGYVKDNQATWYSTAGEAVTAALANGHDYLCLGDDVTLNNGDTITVDVAGSKADLNITGPTEENAKATVYGIDTENYNANTGNYKANTSNSLTVSGNVDVKETTVGGLRYIPLESETEDDTWSFHRLDLKLSHVTLRAGTTKNDMGMYYKATISCDEILAGRVDTYGVALSLVDMPGEGFVFDKDTDFTAVESGLDVSDGTVTVNSGLLRGIWKQDTDDGYSSDSNKNNARRHVYANAYLEIDGQYIMADTENGGKKVASVEADPEKQVNASAVVWTLEEVLQKINETLTVNYTEEIQQNVILPFYNAWVNKVDEIWTALTAIAGLAGNND